MAGVELCMSLAISCVLGPQTQSFEEVRMSDYLASYRSTGRPPQPVPAFPADPGLRAAQGLPPLFVPAPFTDAGPSSSGPTPFGSNPPIQSTSATITDPTKLPIAQTFVPPVVVGAIPGPGPAERETFLNIVVAPEYSHWSPEELRYYAYARGTRLPPPGTTMMPFGATQTSALPPAPGLGDGEQLVSITARPDFSAHSFEELRFAFLRAGTELTSAQIASNFGLGTAPLLAPQNPLNPLAPFAGPPQQQQPPQPTPSTLFGQPQPPAPVAAFPFGSVPQPAAPVQASSGFSFGAPAAPPALVIPPSQPAPTGFNFGQPFGQPPQPQQPQQGGFSFGGRRF
ncbi:hypothetical protein C8F01DRAFT_1164707 [Mycena amicta]|nr:hypothetical protein C8F01DRAFT_1164707 [Mycena amicta]